MAIVYTATINKRTVFGDQVVIYATLTSNGGAYTTGGDTLAPSAIGLSYVDYADANVLIQGSGGATGYLVNITPGVGENANMKIQLYRTGGSTGTIFAEAQGDTPGASFTMNVQFYGV